MEDEVSEVSSTSSQSEDIAHGESDEDEIAGEGFMDDTMQAFHGSSPTAPIEIDEASEIEADDISQLLDEHDQFLNEDGEDELEERLAEDEDDEAGLAEAQALFESEDITSKDDGDPNDNSPADTESRTGSLLDADLLSRQGQSDTNQSAQSNVQNETNEPTQAAEPNHDQSTEPSAQDFPTPTSNLTTEV